MEIGLWHKKEEYTSGLNLAQVDEIFDQMESEEKRSVLMVLLSLPNLCLLAVIAATLFKFRQLD